MVILPKISNFTKIGNFIITLEPEMVESRSKAQKTGVLA